MTIDFLQDFITGANKQRVPRLGKELFDDILNLSQQDSDVLGSLDKLKEKYATVDEANLKYIAGIQKSEDAYKDYVEWTEKSEVATHKFANSITKLGKSLGKMVLSAGIDLLIGYAIQGLFTLADHLITTKAEWKEMAEAAQESFKEANEQIKETEN